jgi:hypothetical protein
VSKDKIRKVLTNLFFFVNLFTYKVQNNLKNMKKIFTLLTAVLLAGALLGQTVPRNVVILEVSTGTWCVYCPGAGNAADQLISEGKSVAVIEYHNGDAFTNAASNARNSYYAITGYPTGNFDGTVPSVGGAACPSGNVYSTYLPLYNTAISTPSLLSICISGSNVGNNYTVNVMVKKVGTITSTNLRMHLVLTETNIPTAPWPPGYSGRQYKYVCKSISSIIFYNRSNKCNLLYLGFTTCSSRYPDTRGTHLCGELQCRMDWYCTIKSSGKQQLRSRSLVARIIDFCQYPARKTRYSDRSY